MTFDHAAMLILIDGGPKMQARLNALAHRADLAHGRECPECGERDKIEDNGAPTSDLTFRCAACDHQWDAAQA